MMLAGSNWGKEEEEEQSHMCTAVCVRVRNMNNVRQTDSYWGQAVGEIMTKEGKC